MSNKYIVLLETHIEKLVLVIVSLVCLWLLVTRVLISPNKVEFGLKKEKSAPGQIDQKIKDHADRLADLLVRPAEPGPAHEPIAAKLRDKISLTIADVNTDVYAYVPPSIHPDKVDDRRYKLPEVAPVRGVSAQLIQTVVYEPIEEIAEKNPYTSQRSAPNDLDMVTVAAEFDVADLYYSFYDCFSGVDVRSEWKDPCLAQPVFAAVELQRQEQLEDEIWSQWQIVPRTRIEARREMFEVIEDAKDLPAGGIKMCLFKFNNRAVTADLLQPEPYRIASEEEEWYPPGLHEKYLDYQKKQDKEDRNKAREEKNKRSDPRDPGTLRGRGRGGLGGAMSRGSEGESRGGGRNGYSGRGRVPRGRGPIDLGGRGEDERGVLEARRTTSKKKTEKEIIDEELTKMLITDETDLSQMQEALTFWAHDDTIESGKVYRYRIRLGVFNPVTGTDQVKPVDQSRQNKVILWSKYSDVTKQIEIPKRLYFFPLRGEASENKAVTVKIFKYKMGYWYGWQGAVRQGEIIGKEVENKDSAENSISISKGSASIPEMIDYSTGSVLVDVKTVNSWVGPKTLTHKYYSDMLYSFNGDAIERMPIQQLYWPREVQLKYQELEKSEKKEKKPFRAWTGGAGRFSGRIKQTRHRYGDEEEDEGGDGRGDDEAAAHRRMFGDR
jgi:hypothetical protein